MTRPSALVVAENLSEASLDEAGLRRVRTTGMLDAGLPIVVSSTWHVIGGFFSVAMVVGWFVGVGAVAARWFESAWMRWVACEVGMQRLRGTEDVLWNERLRAIDVDQVVAVDGLWVLLSRAGVELSM